MTIAACAFAFCFLVSAATLSVRGEVEQDLRARTEAALARTDAPPARIEVSGLVVRLRPLGDAPDVPASVHAEVLAALTTALPGVAVLDLPPAAADTSGGPDPLGLSTLEPATYLPATVSGQTVIVVTERGRNVDLAGTVPDEVTLGAVRSLVRDYRRVGDDNVVVSGTSTAGGIIDGLRGAVATLNTVGDARITATGRMVAVEGTVQGPADAAKVLDRLRRNLQPGYSAQIALRLASPVPREGLGVQVRHTATEVVLEGVCGSAEGRALLNAAARRSWPGATISDAVVVAEVQQPEPDTAGEVAPVFEPTHALVRAVVVLADPVPLTVGASGTGLVEVPVAGASGASAALRARLEAHLPPGTRLFDPAAPPPGD